MPKPREQWTRDQLEAFVAVARHRNFERAGKALHLSQSALSRRIGELESCLGRKPLLDRGHRGKDATLTNEGLKVREFAESLQRMEQRLYDQLQAPARHGGIVRLAGLTSLVPSVVLPALAPYLREHPGVELEIYREPGRALWRAVAEARLHLGIGQERVAEFHTVASEFLGNEEFVLIESSKERCRPDVFLDVSTSDTVTDQFFEKQPTHLRPNEPLRRLHLQDEAGILLGVELGLGRAVKPRHSIPEGAAVRIVEGFEPLLQPVHLLRRKSAQLEEGANEQRTKDKEEREQLLEEKVYDLIKVKVTDHLRASPAKARKATKRA